MNIEEVRAFCLSFPAVGEGFPFDESTIVFKVKGKIFCITDVENFEFINVKCDPEKAIELREQYEAVLPGYHMNKKHWNSLLVDGSLSTSFIKEWITHSYNTVVNSLPKKDRLDL